jgi:uncharacterized membrane protein
MKPKAGRTGLDAPLGRGTSRQRPTSRDRFGRFTEWVARAMGTPAFLLSLTLFCVVWIAWNTLTPLSWRFDAAANGFTALTLMLSLQASYAAPLILLAQNRQDDRDRVQIEQDRQRAERNLADTEYLAREIVALRLALEERNAQAVTRDVLRQELKVLLAELDGADSDAAGESGPDDPEPRTGPVTTSRPRR